MEQLLNPEGTIIRREEARDFATPMEGGGSNNQGGKRSYASMVGGQGKENLDVQEQCEKAFKKVMDKEYRHLSNADAMQHQMGLAIADKKPMFENIAKKANNELFGKLTDYMGGVSAVLDKIALVLEAKYGVDMLPSKARKRRGQEILESHLEPFLQQQTDQQNPIPDMQAAAQGMAPPGASVQQLASNPFGQHMLEQSMMERGVRIREASRQSAMMIDGH